MTTYEIGKIAVTNIIAELSRQGFEVFVPLGDGGEVDLVVYKKSNLYSVQCKAAKIRNGSIQCRFYGVGSEPNSYYKNIDLFAYWCEETNTAYFIWNKNRDSLHEINLRVVPAKNGQKKDINWAENYKWA